MTERYDRSKSSASAGLSLDELSRLISIYGANPSRWPDEARKLQLKDVGMNAELRAQLATESAVDQALDSAPAIEIPDRLREQLMLGFERFEKRGRGRFLGGIAVYVASLKNLVWPGAPWWQPAFALSFSVLVGLSLGLAIPDSISDFGDQQVTMVSDTPTSVDLDQGQ